MFRTTSLDVADYILRQHGGSMPLSRVNALVCICQGWSMALRQLPLFSDDVLAGDQGPYCTMFRSRDGSDPAVGYQWIGGDMSRLTVGERDVVDAVLEAYEGAGLKDIYSDLTRAGSPWQMTVKYGAGPVIPTYRLHSFYADQLGLTEWRDHL